MALLELSVIEDRGSQALDWGDRLALGAIAGILYRALLEDCLGFNCYALSIVGHARTIDSDVKTIVGHARTIDSDVKRIDDRTFSTTADDGVFFWGTTRMLHPLFNKNAAFGRSSGVDGIYPRPDVSKIDHPFGLIGDITEFGKKASACNTEI